MKKIKNWFIHLLGGVTLEESRESDMNSFYLGRFSCIKSVRHKAISMYGKPADEWCKNMYKYIDDCYQNYGK